MKSIVNHLIRLILRIICKLDIDELQKIPDDGAYILVVNHVNVLDVPLVVTNLWPRPATGLVKKESWDKPFLAFLFNLWEGIPIDRDSADFKAFQMAKQALKDGKILAIAPEGTRTGHGCLIRGKPGVAILASKCDVPIIPLVYYGHENFNENIKKLKRTPVKIRVGEPFELNLDGQPRSKTLFQDATDAIMARIAALLPDQYRGYYQDVEKFHQPYLKPLD